MVYNSIYTIICKETAMNTREERGMVIAAMCRLNKTPDGAWLVPSQSGTEIYTVNLEKKNLHVSRSQGKRNIRASTITLASFVHKRDVLPDGTMIERSQSH